MGIFGFNEIGGIAKQINAAAYACKHTSPAIRIQVNSITWYVWCESTIFEPKVGLYGSDWGLLSGGKGTLDVTYGQWVECTLDVPVILEASTVVWLAGRCSTSPKKLCYYNDDDETIGAANYWPYGTFPPETFEPVAYLDRLFSVYATYEAAPLAKPAQGFIL